MSEAESLIWKAFWSNEHILLNTRIPYTKRQALLDSFGRGVIQSRAASWVPARNTYESWDKLQNKLLALLLRLFPEPDETPERFSIRRNRAVGRIPRVPWSQHAARSAVTWVSHMLRHPTDPAGRCWQVQNAAWIADRRSSASSKATNAVSRTCTRDGKGKIYRFDDSGWTKTAEVSPDDSPHKVHRSTLRLLQLLKVPTRQGTQQQATTATSFL